MVMANMQSSSDNLPQTLRPLVLFCLPEERSVAVEAAGFELPAVFAEPDFALSWSAQQQGWMRKLAMNHRTFCQADAENLILRLNS